MVFGSLRLTHMSAAVQLVPARAKIVIPYFFHIYDGDPSIIKISAITAHPVNPFMPKCTEVGESSRELLDSPCLLQPEEISHGRQIIAYV